MWIITDFSVCTGLIRALPGKCPLLALASLRNPQHFHRLCTGLAPLRTSHPHVCAQTAGQQSSGRPAGRQQRTGAGAGPCMPGQRAACGYPGHAGPIARPWRVRRTSGAAGLTSSAGGSHVEGQAVSSPVRHDQGVSPPETLSAADGCRILRLLSVAVRIIVSAGAGPRYLYDAGQQPIIGF